MSSVDDARTILGRYGLEEADVEPVPVGLINRTYRVARRDRQFILQKVNPIFTPAVHDDIDAVTRHLEAKGMKTPRLVPSLAGSLYVEREGEVWRLMTLVEGVTYDSIESLPQARAAGELLARFHEAVQDLSYQFKNRRLGVHDTAKHLQTLRTALAEHTDHPRRGTVEPLAKEILEKAAALPPLPPVAARVVHGDPKISNLMFSEETGQAICMIDLDTLARMPIYLELGDAMRSWCNAGGEDLTSPTFSVDLFGAAMEGYAAVARDMLTDDEWQSILPATQTIMVELAARFCADAFNETYFGWDATRYQSRSEHNEVRARGQLALASSLERVLDTARSRLAHAFST